MQAFLALPFLAFLHLALSPLVAVLLRHLPAALGRRLAHFFLMTHLVQDVFHPLRALFPQLTVVFLTQLPSLLIGFPFFLLFFLSSVMWDSVALTATQAAK